MLIKTYGIALLRFKDQKLNYKPARFESTDEEVLIKTEILQSGAPPLPIDYMLEKMVIHGKFLILLLKV